MPASAQVPQLMEMPSAAARLTASGLAAIAVMNLGEGGVTRKRDCARVGGRMGAQRQPLARRSGLAAPSAAHCGAGGTRAAHMALLTQVVWKQVFIT